MKVRDEKIVDCRWCDHDRFQLDAVDLHYGGSGMPAWLDILPTRQGPWGACLLLDRQGKRHRSSVHRVYSSGWLQESGLRARLEGVPPRRRSLLLQYPRV
jgi:hypothetical protein